MKIVTVVGARPQFIKASPVSRCLRVAGVREYLVHTGQHYNHEMSQIFFDEMGIPSPDVNLEIGSGTHGWQTGQMIIGIEEIILAEKPDLVLVYGDTNSTLAAALAAAKVHIPLAHVEAGLRSFNREMPEEHNRVLTDHCSDLLLCPTQTALNNLAHEGIRKGVHWVGDTMYDAVIQFTNSAQRQSNILKQLNLQPKGYLLATVHRPYNTDNTDILREVLSALQEIQELVVFPAHPRTQQKIDELKDVFRRDEDSLIIIPPVGYLDMLVLEQNARMIITDSGGIQKEAYFLKVPCLTLRPETEWVETVKAGWNVLVGTQRVKILEQVEQYQTPSTPPENLFGDGNAAENITSILMESNV